MKKLESVPVNVEQKMRFVTQVINCTERKKMQRNGTPLTHITGPVELVDARANGKSEP